MQSVDLHTHSQHSDGRLAVAELIDLAHQAGVDMLALTDHDTTAGIDEAKQLAQAQAIQLIAGVEISVSWRGRTIHILGLGIEPNNPTLQAGLQSLRDKREERAQMINDKLVAAGIEGAMDWVQHRVNGGLISRTHFAEFLVHAGHAKDIRAVFKQYLVSGKTGHVSVHWCDMEQALSWIRDAGGVAVIAHPARYKLTRSKLVSLLEEFIALGGKGLEVVSSSHSEADCRHMAELAQQFQLYASCGSDFHSPDQPWARLGRIAALPAKCTPIWSLWSENCN